MGKVKDCINWMQLSMRNQYFNAADPILVLESLTRFVAEADIFGMNEAQAYFSLLYFLRGGAEEQLISIRGSSQASERDVSCWT